LKSRFDSFVAFEHGRRRTVARAGAEHIAKATATRNNFNCVPTRFAGLVKQAPVAAMIAPIPWAAVSAVATPAPSTQ